MKARHAYILGIVGIVAFVGFMSMNADANGTDVIYEEDFEDSCPPSGWTIGEKPANGDTWACSTVLPGICVQGGASGTFMAFDDDDYGPGSDNPQEWLVSPAVNCGNYENIALSWTGDFQDFAGHGEFWVNVSNDAGVTWTNVYHADMDVGGFDTDSAIPVDISAVADHSSHVMVNFTYSDTDSTGTSDNAWGALVDDVTLTGTPTGFVYIDENHNGSYDDGEWHGVFIADAVDNAERGDTIYVWNGSYWETNITIDMPLTVIGNTSVDALAGIDMPRTTYLNYTDKGFIINDTSHVNISGFYLVNKGRMEMCGGVSLNHSSHCNISGNIIMGDADGIYLNDSHYNTIYNNFIYDNNFVGIWMVGSSNNTIEMNNLTGNYYGILYEPYEAMQLKFSWNTIRHNNISYNGGWGIVMRGTDNETIEYNDFYGNGLDGGGAIHFIGVNDGIIAHNTMMYNYPWGVWLEHCEEVTVEDNTILGGETVNDNGNAHTYHVYLKESEGWHLHDEVHFSHRYGREVIDLPLPDVDGEYKVRISQSGGTAAHIDYVALLDGGETPPAGASYVDGGDILQKVVAADNDVADAWGKTIELSWDGTFTSTRLVLVANEEQPIPEIPHRTPSVMFPSFMEPYRIEETGAVDVDGTLDDLGDADFRAYWIPTTGHPRGYTYVWLRSDGEYLSGAMEVTGDNTYDDTGWGSLYIATGREVQEFRVTATDHAYGVDSFVYTDAVGWQHMLYEFRIPLDEIGAAIGDTVRVGYGSYGTFGPMTGPTGVYISNGMYLPPNTDECFNTLEDNTISGHDYGVLLSGTDNETLAGNTITYNFEAGVYSMYSENISIIDHNNFSHNGPVSGWEYHTGGVVFEHTHHSDVAGNFFTDNRGGAINFIASRHNDIIDNDIIENCGWLHGIGIIENANHTYIATNNIRDNTGPGIEILHTGYTRVEDNNITGNAFAGIYMYRAPYTDINRNFIADNIDGESGIHIGKESNHSSITNNTIKANGVGIYINGGPNTTGYYWNVDTQIHWNQIYDNTEYGLWYEMSTGGTTPYVNATWNWWGAANGPSSDSGNMQDPVTNTYATGSGDEINGSAAYANIHFDPWMGLYLYQGWNMVSPGFIPEVGTAGDLADLIGDNCTVITRWDSDKQRYVSYIPGSGAGFTLRDGEGYFVYVTHDTNVQFTGGLASPSIDLTLSDGFNLVGWPDVGYRQASWFAGQIDNAVKVSMYDAETQTWLPEYIAALPISNDFDVLMGDGVFVFVNPGPSNLGGGA